MAELLEAVDEIVGEADAHAATAVGAVENEDVEWHARCLGRPWALRRGLSDSASLSRLRERDGPAAKRWEGEGRRRPPSSNFA